VQGAGKTKYTLGHDETGLLRFIRANFGPKLQTIVNNLPAKTREVRPSHRLTQLLDQVQATRGTTNATRRAAALQKA
jgi:hypothetical protein